MAELDPNAWYRLSETRVDNSTGPFSLNLQLRDVGLRVHPISDGTAAWQFQPVGDVKGRYLMRLDQAGVKQQLGVCLDPNEPAAGNTVACLQPSSIDTSQQWDVSDFGSGTFKLVNVGNGTNYVLDVHPKANLFMSSSIEGSPGVAENQLAQHWVMSSVSAVNDGAYSTIYSGNVAVSTNSATLSSSTTSTQPSTTTTTTITQPTSLFSRVATMASAGTTGAPTATPTTAIVSSKGISTAAGAGIGVAVALSVVGLIGAVAFLWWRRSQQPAKTRYSEVEPKNGDAPERGPSLGVSPYGDSAPSSLHGVSPTVGVSSLNSWQPASSVAVPPAASFINGQQPVAMNNAPHGAYFAGQQPVQGGQGAYYGHLPQQQAAPHPGYFDGHQQVAGGQQTGYYEGQQQAMNGQQAASFINGQQTVPAVTERVPSPLTSGRRSDSFDGPIASIYGQRAIAAPPPTTVQHSGASIYGQRISPSARQAIPSIYGQKVSTISAVNRHQFDHPTARNAFGSGKGAADSQSTTRNALGASTNQTSSTVNLADFEPMPQAHELEAAERDIVRRQHELGVFHHGPNLLNEEASKTKAPPRAEPPKAELSAYQHGPDTFERNEAKMLGAPTAELGAYQHGPDTFENEHEAKVLGGFHPGPEHGTEKFTREREDKVLGSFHSIMNAARPTGRGGQADGPAPQAFEMNPLRPPPR